MNDYKNEEQDLALLEEIRYKESIISYLSNEVNNLSQYTASLEADVRCLSECLTSNGIPIPY